MPSKPRTYVRKTAAARPVVGEGQPSPEIPHSINMSAFEPDMVNHPPHYTGGPPCPGCGRPIECIDAIEGSTFLRGSAMKYLWRAGEKYDLVEDLEKAIWYINREIAQANRRQEMG